MRDGHQPPTPVSPGHFNRAAILLLSVFCLWIVLQALLGTGYGPDFAALREAAPKLIRGLGLTIYISFVSVFIGSAIALGLLVGPPSGKASPCGASSSAARR